MKQKLENFNKYAPTFRTMTRLDEMPSATPADMVDHAREHLGDDVPPQLISGKWVDIDDEPLLFYLGQRDKKDTVEKLVNLFTCLWASYSRSVYRWLRISMVSMLQREPVLVSRRTTSMMVSQ